ncbi:hypothetical protein [Microvirga sp. VF16]|uniref:hypothetical protein n=1 Tax=Microvirga sp. VF16 TaxID=2807101 RepID=UPI0035303A30
MSLFHTSGTLLSRHPYSERALGINGAYEPWFKTDKAAGVHEYTSPIDGVTRIGGFQRNHIFPIGVLASVGRDEALIVWNRLFVFRIVLIGFARCHDRHPGLEPRTATAATGGGGGGARRARRHR